MATSSSWKSRSILYGPGGVLKGDKAAQLKGGKDIRVLLFSGKGVEITTEGDYEFHSVKGAVEKGKGGYTPAGSGEFKPANSVFCLKEKCYSGRLRVVADGGGFHYINILSVEEYLVSVVGHEMSPTWPIEALKAQAVVARTYVLERIGREQKDLYDIGVTTKDQVYGGRIDKDKNVREAVHKTESQILTYHGDIAKVFFHSCCGGETASAGEVWKEEIPYLKNRRCEFRESPEYNWMVVITRREFEGKFSLRDLGSVKVASRTKSNRAETIVISAGGKEIKVTASQFRSLLGAEKIRSTRFAVDMEGGQVVVRGKGYGHGVGLCQWCARIMAEKQSMQYRSILQYFFPGTTLSKIR